MEKEEPIVQKGDVVYRFTTSISQQKGDGGSGFLFEWKQVGTVRSVRGSMIHLKSSRKAHRRIPLDKMNRVERIGLQAGGYASSLVLAAQLSSEGKELIVSHIIEQKQLYDNLLRIPS